MRCTPRGLPDITPAILQRFLAGTCGVSLLRALLAQPQALLLDEPFSRLDKTLRASFRAWVFAAVRARNIPVVLVTHDEEDIPPGGDVISSLAGNKRPGPVLTQGFLFQVR